MYKIFSIIISILALLLLGLELFIYHDKTGSISSNFVIFLVIVNFIPTLIFLGVGLIAKKFNWKKVTNICVNVLLSLLTILYFLFISLGITAAAFFWDTTPKEPTIENYQSELYKIKARYAPGFDHFPMVLPNNISNYYFYIENSFDGYDTHYLKFNTDSSYINNEFKNKCNNQTISKEQVNEDNYISYYTTRFDDATQYCILHKRTPDEHYTNGIATNNTRNTIYYFYANY